MPISVTCSACGAKFAIKEEFAGRKVRCSECQAVLSVPKATEVADRPGLSTSDEDNRDRPSRRRDEEALAETQPSRARTRADEDEDKPKRERRPWDPVEEEEVDEEGEGHPAFRYDKFLMRQKLFTILSEKYTVTNEFGKALMFIQRPAMAMQSCLAIGGFIFMIVLAIAGAALLASQFVGDMAIVVGIATGILGLVLAFVVLLRFIPRRHITFYSDESKTEPLMRVLQDQKFFLINAWYTLVDDEGEVLARFHKNYLYNILRKRWYIHDAEGNLLCTVKEDSLIISLLRRTVGLVLEEAPLVGLIFAGVFRTNFIFLHAEDENVLGEFNRKFTILDRYVLDMTRDPERTIDRRVAAAMGVLLDTGEGR